MMQRLREIGTWPLKVYRRLGMGDGGHRANWLIWAAGFGAGWMAMPDASAMKAAPAAVPRPAFVGLGTYRLPYADGTVVKVFDDFETHRPTGRIDLVAIGQEGQVRVVAAAPGRVVAIQDGYAERQSSRAAKDCRNNYLWIAHANGEWTNYSHLAFRSVGGDAGLRVGDTVQAGQFIGLEGDVGCAMLRHLHFEVATPADGAEIDGGGFLLDNAEGQRERRPNFCGVPGGWIQKDVTYTASPCG